MARVTHGHRGVQIAVITVVTAAAALYVGIASVFTGSAIHKTSKTSATSPMDYAIGVVDASEPSRYAPPTATALVGYAETYVNDFLGTSLPSGWETFTGVPGNDPQGQFGSAHVTVNGGLLRLNTWRDPAYNNEWVTGGLCQCGFSQTYGAYFVRSRVTGAGPTEVELLWPTSNTWPPEIDFNESGSVTKSTSATLHYGTSDHLDQRTLMIDGTHWHTWGVIWTPTSITYTVDGRAWGRVTKSAEIPDQPMELHIQQQTECSLSYECPTAPESMYVDWVAEFTPNAP
ncbi:MAG: glycoside hydrolase family 16 protein [Acidimicrobiales bacterium]